MLFEFSIIPLGTGPALSEQIAPVLKMVDESGLPYKVNPMGTVVEGEWDEVMALIRRCERAVMEKSERVLTKIEIDDRKGVKNAIQGKVKSVEKRLGKELKK